MDGNLIICELKTFFHTSYYGNREKKLMYNILLLTTIGVITDICFNVLNIIN